MVVELLKDPPPPEKLPAGSDRRRSRRHVVTLPATLLPEGSKDASAKLEVVVRDVSLHGAGLRCEVPLAAGDMYVLDIGAGPLNLHARIRVASCRKRGGTWDVGVEFF
jgi:hypothetical protein